MNIFVDVFFISFYRVFRKINIFNGMEIFVDYFSGVNILGVLRFFWGHF